MYMQCLCMASHSHLHAQQTMKSFTLKKPQTPKVQNCKNWCSEPSHFEHASYYSWTLSQMQLLLINNSGSRSIIAIFTVLHSRWFCITYSWAWDWSRFGCSLLRSLMWRKQVEAQITLCCKGVCQRHFTNCSLWLSNSVISGCAFCYAEWYTYRWCVCFDAVLLHPLCQLFHPRHCILTSIRELLYK